MSSYAGLPMTKRLIILGRWQGTLMSLEEPKSSHPSNETPLQGWKEIAAYLERDQRTARRWELVDGLPIRRLRAERRSSVYAYPSEIED